MRLLFLRYFFEIRLIPNEAIIGGLSTESSAFVFLRGLVSPTQLGVIADVPALCDVLFSSGRVRFASELILDSNPFL